MKITVTKQDFLTAKELFKLPEHMYVHDCPNALAVLRAFDATRDEVWVGMANIYVGDQRFNIPAEALRMIARFDYGRGNYDEVEDVTYELQETH